MSSRIAIRNAIRVQIKFYLNYYQLLDPGSYICEGGRDAYHQKRDEQSKTFSLWNYIGLLLVLKERSNLQDDLFHLHFKTHDYFCLHVFWNNFCFLCPQMSAFLFYSHYPQISHFYCFFNCWNLPWLPSHLLHSVRLSCLINHPPNSVLSVLWLSELKAC